MNLSAFGVESDGFPNIYAVIDMQNDTSYCHVSYYNPKFSSKIYCLNKSDLDSIKSIIGLSDLKKLKPKYSDMLSDQPTSTTIFYLSDGQFKVSDYGLIGESPLRELYKLVYKLEVNFRH